MSELVRRFSLGLGLVALSMCLPFAVQAQTTVFINELHYDNDGSDTNESVEVAGPAGTDLTNWSLVFYNGNGGAQYSTLNLSGTIDNEGDGFGALSFAESGIQNGSPDGIALVNDGVVVQFLSYEGAFTATDGPANGMMSEDIGVSEPSNASATQSLQLVGLGTVAEDFMWSGPADASMGDLNAGQFFKAPAIRIVTVDHTNDNITIKNFGAADVNVSDYNLCAGPGRYQALNTAGLVTGDLMLSGDEEVTIDFTQSDLTATEGLGLFLDNSDFGSDDPDQILDYVQWGAANQARVTEAVTAGRWDGADNFISGGTPYAFGGFGDDVGSIFWVVNEAPFTSFETEDLVEASLDGAEIEVSFSNEVFKDGVFDLNNFTINNGPAGLTVDKVELDGNVSQGIITLAYNGGPFDTNITGVTFTIDGAELFGGGNATSDPFEIQAVAEENVSKSFVNTIQGQVLGTYASGVFDESAAEIAAYDPVTSRLFFTDANSSVLRVLDISDPTSPAEVGSGIMLAGEPNSVSVNSTLGLAAVAVAGATFDANGFVQFFDTQTLSQVGSNVTVGVLPDMLTFTPDGNKVVVANEGEPNDDYTVDPEGSVSVITIPAIPANLGNGDVVNISLSGLNAQEATLKSEGVRIFGPGATVAQDLEPEFVAITPDNTTAYVACQENNALLVVDLGTNTITDVLALGTKDHSLPGNGLDLSNRDGAISIARWPVLGMYQPDGMAIYNDGTSNFLVTANEGDAREYEGSPGFVELERINDFDLDDTNFPGEAGLLQEAAMGRLEVTNTLGDIGMDGDYEELYSFGARSFSIWDASGNQVWDSGNQLEVLVRDRSPEIFNTTNDENAFDNRSDDAGPEPEGVTLGEIDGRTYAFIGLERISSIAIYDITDETNPVFAGYLSNRDPEASDEAIAMGNGGDLGPEGLVFVSSNESPNGENLLVVTNEVSGTVTVWQIGEVPPPSGPMTALDENFDSSCPSLPEGWSEFHTGVDLIGCDSENTYINFDGFEAGAGVSYLLAPALNLSDGGYFMNFNYVSRFTGPEPQVLVSFDYPGSGDPAGFTFTNVSEATDILVNEQTADNTFINSGPIDITGLVGENVTFAFRYESLGTGGGNSRRLRIDRFEVSQPAVLISEIFDNTCPNLPAGFVEFNEGLDLISCGDDEYVDFNGFGVGAGVSWLITPMVDLSFEEVSLSFRYVNQFGGPDPEILYSTNYAGTGDPNLATFTNITAAEDIVKVQTDGAFLPTGEIDLSFIGEPAYIAFKYTSVGSGGGQSLRFRIDDLEIARPVSNTPVGMKTIAEIQGEGEISPFDGSQATTQGIVTAIFDGNEPFPGAGFNSNLGGFYIQDQTPDGNDLTSDGIFVEASQIELGVFVNVGDLVSLKGFIGEKFDQTVLGDVSDVEVLSTGNSLPAPASIDFPVSSAEYLERFEGMLVSVVDELTVRENRNLNNNGEVFLAEGGRVYQPTQLIDPNDGSPTGNNFEGLSNVGAVETEFENIAKRSIVLDDGRIGSSLLPIPYLNGGTLRVGSTVSNLSGILSFDFDAYRIQPTEAPTFTYDDRPDLPDIGMHRLKVVAFNVLNYFNGDGMGGGFPTSRGAATSAEFDRQSDKIIAALAEMDGDVVGLVEIENEDDAGESALEELVDELNAEVGAGTYDFINTGTIRRGDDTADEIRVAIIYKPATVTPVGDFAVLNNDFDENYKDDKNRPALAQSFEEVGTEEVFTVVVNHLKSKGSGCGDGDDDEFQGNCNGTRTDAALVQSEWLTTDPTKQMDPDFLVIGDINAYAQEDPVDAFRSNGFRLLSTEPDLNHSFVFDGLSGALDHVLVTPNASVQISGAATWHINADEPDFLEYDGEESFFEPSPFRSSDHDPIIVGLNLDGSIPPPVGQGQGTIVVQVNNSSDDAEELSATEVNNFGLDEGDLDLSSSDLELVDDASFNGTGQTVGIRFNGIEIPQGSIILNAFIEFNQEDENDGVTNVTFRAEASDNAATFANTPFNISTRPVTGASVDWDIPAFTTTGIPINTPKLTSLVQEVVSREGWQPGNSMAFIVTGSGEREVSTFDTEEGGVLAPKLIIDYLPLNGVMAQVNSSTDDAEELSASEMNNFGLDEGDLDLASSDLELVDDTFFNGAGQTVGVRFANLDIPNGAKVERAFIIFNQEDENDGETIVTFKTEATDDALTFANTPFNISSRPVSSAGVQWNIPAFTETGVSIMTPDLTDIVQEAVSRPGWTPGNAMAFIMTGSGEREVSTWDTEEGGILAPRLVVDFVPVQTEEYPVIASTDDAEELSSTEMNNFGLDEGDLDLASSDLELADDASFNGTGQTIGIRFANIDIPRSAVIERAYIRFNREDANAGETIVQFRVEDEDDAQTFANTPFNISTRNVSDDFVEWNIPEFTAGEVGSPVNTPDLTDLVQATINRDGWQQGNAMAFVVTGSGEREVSTWDTEEGGILAPVLVIDVLKSEAASAALPELIADIPDITVRAGFTAEVDLKAFFEDKDSKLFYSAQGLNGVPLPPEISLDDEEGILRANFDEPTHITVVAEAGSFGETAEGQFSIIVEPAPNRVLEKISTIQIGTQFDEGAAEISAFDSSTDRLFVTNSEADRIEVIDLSDPSNPSTLSPLPIATFGGGVNSVAVNNGILAAAIENNDPQMPGKVYLFNTSDGSQIANYDVGALPDMVTFDETGDYILVANEGEPNDDYTVDPEGSVSVIDISSGAGSGSVSTATFTSFNGMQATLEADGVRIFGPGASVAQDLEPEFITTQGGTAYVTLQENNAIAIVDIATATVSAIEGLGYKDHGQPGNGIDVPNTPDDEIFIDNRLPFKGMYQPDAIASYVAGMNTYLVTANEGDAREYGFDTTSESECNSAGGEFDAEDEFCLVFTDETKVKDVTLDVGIFGEAIEGIQNLAADLKITTTSMQNGGNEYQELLTFGSRSFSIWDASGNLVFDSEDDFEQITASVFPENFNASNSNNSFKNRSDDKGPEPEAVTIGEVEGITYAFIGLERIGGIAVYDITDPMNAEFIEYVNNRDFSLDAEDDFLTHGDTGPEGLVFIPALESPNNQPLLIVSNEVSGTVTTYTVGEAVNPFTLSIFHNNDGESDVLPDMINLNGEEVPAGGAGQFVKTLNNKRNEAALAGGQTITLSSGDNFLPGPEFDAGVEDEIFYDAVLLDAIDYDAIALGNHDFDFGAVTLAEFINEFETNLAPYVSANLDFSNVPEMNALVMAERVVKSTIVQKGNEFIGIVGLTTTDLDVISSPGNTIILENIAEIAQEQIDALTNEGVNKIILISHLQGLTEDRALLADLTDVDIVIAGGGDELLSNNPDIGQPYNINPIDGYPIVEQDADGKDVYIVTTPGQYRYLGNLIVDFDEDGNVIEVVNGSDIILVTGEADPSVVASVEDPVAAFLEESATTVIATTEVDLDFRREELRKRETNGGNLFADALLWESLRRFEEFGANEPDIAIQNSGGLRLEDILPEGGITDLDTRQIASFTNIVSVMEDITADQLKTLIEWGVGRAPILDGRFPQIAGFEVVYDQSRDAIVIEDDEIVSPGEKVISITLEDGTELVANGRVVEDAPTVDLASIDFTLNDGDGYPFELLGLTEFTKVASTYQQAFKNYLVEADGLNGTVTASEYPFTSTTERNIESTANEVNLSLSANEVDEGETLVVTATASNAVSADRTISIQISGIDSDDLDDDEALPTAIVIESGETSGSVELNLELDDLDEDDETFTVAITGFSNELLVYGENSEVSLGIVDVVLETPLSISGTVTDEDENEILEGLVTLYSVTNGGFEVVETAELDDENTFAFEDLEEGEYVVEVAPAAELEDSYFKTYYDGALSLAEAEEIELEGESEEIEVEVISKPTQQGNGGNGTITGTLTDEEESNRQTQDALSGVDVFLLDEDGNIVGFDTTDNNGEFTFTGLLPGNYILSVDYEGLAIEGAEITVGDDPVVLELEISGDTIVSTVVETTGIGDELTELVIYPNPFITEVFIDNVNIERIDLKSVSGQSIRTFFAGGSDQIRLDLSDLQNGVYFLELRDQAGQVTLKRILKN